MSASRRLMRVWGGVTLAAVALASLDAEAGWHERYVVQGGGSSGGEAVVRTNGSSGDSSGGSSGGSYGSSGGGSYGSSGGSYGSYGSSRSW
jgi:hypothetical protein